MPRLRARRLRFLCLTLPLCLACGDSTGPVSECEIQPLPLASEADGPTVTDVALEVQEGVGVIVLATATDPQGDGDLLDVVQSVGIFRNVRCSGQPIVVEDDLAGSGVEESFGTAVDAGTEPDLFDAISEADEWPVEVGFRDASGLLTGGQVMADVLHP